MKNKNLYIQEIINIIKKYNISINDIEQFIINYYEKFSPIDKIKLLKQYNQITNKNISTIDNDYININSTNYNDIDEDDDFIYV